MTCVHVSCTDTQALCMSLISQCWSLGSSNPSEFNYRLWLLRCQMSWSSSQITIISKVEMFQELLLSFLQWTTVFLWHNLYIKIWNLIGWYTLQLKHRNAITRLLQGLLLSFPYVWLSLDTSWNLKKVQMQKHACMYNKGQKLCPEKTAQICSLQKVHSQKNTRKHLGKELVFWI